jgi:hypothetical protein
MKPSLFALSVYTLVWVTFGLLGSGEEIHMDSEEATTRPYAKSTKTLGECTLEYVYNKGKDFAE